MEKKELQLQPRLQCLADLVPQGARLADVGTDHGYLPVWLLQHGRMESAIASDINALPLDHARATAAELKEIFGEDFYLEIQDHGLSEQKAIIPLIMSIAEELDIPLEEVSRALDAVCAPASLYDPVYSDGGDPLTVMDQVRDTKNTEDGWMEHITLQNAFRALNDREKQILSLRFYDGKTQMEVASALGISQAQVSRLEKGAIGAMRKSVSVS